MEPDCGQVPRQAVRYLIYAVVPDWIGSQGSENAFVYCSDFTVFSTARIVNRSKQSVECSF